MALAGRLVTFPRLVVAAPHGKSGKTTVCLGLCAALAQRGLAVQPFKKGPDYIDPSWLGHAAGRPCRTLDPVLLGPGAGLLTAFQEGARDADLSVIEGNHGLYDSALPECEEGRGGAANGEPKAMAPGWGSTAAVARALQAPILLVVNGARMGRSAAALVHGFQTFEPGTPIQGVILNNVAHARHEAKLRQAIERACRLPVLGALPRDEALAIPDRHLGLVPRGEQEALLPAVEACRAAAERCLDLEAILAVARGAPPLPAPSRVEPRPAIPAVTVGVLRDRAFSFYYPENLEALERAGARLVFLDALHDPHLPALGALYIGGGFPEIFAGELAANASLRAEIRLAIEAGLPVYAECGGLMYLCRRITWGDRSSEMVGALPFEVEMTDHPQGHGYVEAAVVAENPFLPVGTRLRGHEFHHSRLSGEAGGLATAYALTRGQGLDGRRDGLLYRNVLAAYLHLHADGVPAWAEGIVGQARGRYGS